MKTPQNLQPSFDDDISIADMINFFKSHKKMILISVIIGGIMGGLFANFTEPVYKGSVLISFAKVSGVSVVNPKVIASKSYMDNLYSKETFVNCNPYFYKDKDKDKDFNISSIVNASVTKDGDLIELRMQDKNKTVIKDCLSSIADDFLTNQNTIADPVIQLKNNSLRLAEEKLKNAEEFQSNLNNRLTRESKKIGGRLGLEDLFYSNLLSLNRKDINEIMDEINTIKIDLHSANKLASIVIPITIEKKSSLSPKLGSLLGLFLGLCLGILLPLIKQIILKIS
jgi:hypothetical protein